jgi:outer membrane lipoprotein-sorting protein
MQAIEIVDPDGEQTVIRFANVQTDTGITDAMLELNAPTGTRVVRPLEAYQAAPSR